MTPLNSLQPGTTARVVRLGGERGFRRRLMELGLLPGTDLRLVRRVDVGALLELEVRGAHLSLRQQEAGELFVAAREG
jgi:ferrous iron transport protein A